MGDRNELTIWDRVMSIAEENPEMVGQFASDGISTIVTNLISIGKDLGEQASEAALRKIEVQASTYLAALDKRKEIELAQIQKEREESLSRIDMAKIFMENHKEDIHELVTAISKESNITIKTANTLALKVLTNNITSIMDVEKPKKSFFSRWKKKKMGDDIIDC